MDNDDIFEKIATEKFANEDDETFVDDEYLKLQKEFNDWEKVRENALDKGYDETKINALTKKVENLKKKLSESHNGDKLIRKLKNEIDELTQERLHIDNKLELLTHQLRKLCPKDSEYLNDPALLNGSVVNGKFVENPEKDDNDELRDEINKRRTLAKMTGQYDSSNHVKFKNIKNMLTKNNDWF